jgi:hypothetical protein
MRIRQATHILAGLVCIATIAAPAWAQPAATGTPGGQLRGEIGLTFNVLRYEGETSRAGFGVDVSRTIGQPGNDVSVQIAGDLGVSYFAGASDATYTYSGATQTSLMGGIRLVVRGRSKATLFAQALAGAMRCCSETDAATMFGVGVDVPVSGRRVNLRLQADVPVVFFKAGVNDDGTAYDAGHDFGFRVNVGLAIALGGR